MREMKYLTAPSGWKPADPNPFSPDGRHGPGWSCFYIDGVDRRVNFCGGGKTGPFTFRLGADCPRLKISIADLLRYENQRGRQVIVSCPESMDLHALVNQALSETPDPSEIRAEDPRWVVHSTTLAAWESIQADAVRIRIGEMLHAAAKRNGGR